MDIHNHYDYPRRRSSLAAAAAAAARLQTPSLTSLTSTTSRTSSMLTSGSGGAADRDSALGSATIVGGHSTPPLIDLDDREDSAADTAGGLLKRPLAFDAGAGVTPTDKLRALLRQMEGEVRAAKPEPQRAPPGAAAPPPTLRRSTSSHSHSPGRGPSASSTQRPTSPSPPRETEDEYSPPTPPPRITNPYLYSRRAMERRESEELKRRSPSPSRRLPSRAIALRAAASAAATAVREPEPTPKRDHKPTPLETFIASHPDPFPEASSSRTRIEPPAPRAPSPSRKGKERVQHYDDREPSLPNRTPHYDDEDDEEEHRYRQEYEEPSPPRRRGLTPRRAVVESPPDTSAAFAAGLNGEGSEYDLEEDSAPPWREDDTVDSLDSGTGRRQRFLAAEERSHSRSRDYITHASAQTSGTGASFATAPSRRQGGLPPDTSLPAIPDPESSDEEDVRAMRHREMLLRPFSRESTDSLRKSTSPYAERSRQTSEPEEPTRYDTARERSRRTPEPEEPTRYDTARDSARFDALRASNATATPSFKEARSVVRNRSSMYEEEVDQQPGRARTPPVIRSPTLHRKESLQSLREIAKSSFHERDEHLSREEDKEPPITHEPPSPRESPPKASPPREREQYQASPLREREQYQELREPILRASRDSRGSRHSLRNSGSPKAQREVSKSPALEESDTLPLSPEDPPERIRYREPPSFSGARSSFRSVSARLSLAKSNNVRWSPEVETRAIEQTSTQGTEEAEVSWAPDAQEHSTPARPRWSPEEERRELQRTPPRDEYAAPLRNSSSHREIRDARNEYSSPPRETLEASNAYSSPSRNIDEAPETSERSESQRTPPRQTRNEPVPSTPSLPPSTSPASSPPVALRTPAPKPGPEETAPVPATPEPAISATPAHLKGMKTPRPPGAWGTPIPARTATASEPDTTPETADTAEEAEPARVPVTPKPPAPSIPDYALMKTPRPPGGWYSPAPSSTPGPSLASAPHPKAHPRLPGTPTPAPALNPNRTMNGLPTPRPPGAWYNSPAQQRQPNLPSRFSSLRNEILPDSSVSSQGSASTGEVSFHRLRTSPKRSPPQSKEGQESNESKHDKENRGPTFLPASTTAAQKNALQAPVLRSPKRSPVWSPPARRVSSAGPASPVTPTKATKLDSDDSFDLNASWAGRLQRLVMSPIRRPTPNTALAEAQLALETASKASAAARSRVEDAQRAWLDALATIPENPQPVPEPVRVVQVARKGLSWGVFFFWLSVELVLAWVVFRVTLDYATSARLLGSLDPWHPQFGSYALNVPLPAGLQAFAVRKPTPTNLFDLLDMLGITGAGNARVLRPPT